MLLQMNKQHAQSPRTQEVQSWGSFLDLYDAKIPDFHTARTHNSFFFLWEDLGEENISWLLSFERKKCRLLRPVGP